MLLTKGKANLTWTMGYNELNQRDSFWSTWLHLLFWPALDADMIFESAAQQQPDGKIPVCVLPVIVRDDNVDTTAYYVLRAARHYQHTGNASFLRAVYPSVRRALAYLRGRDFGGHGAPEALNTSFWADWLDVPYVQGRRYAPHFDLLYLAAVRVGGQMAAVLGEAADEARFATWYAAGYAFVNADFSYVYNATLGGYDVTGLWNESAGVYQDSWFDGRPIGWVYADAAVGAFFGVVPADRARRVDDWLHLRGPENAFGLRNVWPYLTFNGTDPPGQYGNGGVYPWFNCISVATRLRSGLAARGAGLFANLTNNMLYRRDQPLPYTPFEYAHGDTGLDDGDAPQGWDGSCFLRASLGAWALAPASRVWAHPPGDLLAALRGAAGGGDVAGELAGGQQQEEEGSEEEGVLTYHLTLPHTLQRGAGGSSSGGGSAQVRSAMPVQVGGRTRVLSVVAAAVGTAAGAHLGGPPLALPGTTLELTLHGDAVPATAAVGRSPQPLGAFEWGWSSACERTGAAAAVPPAPTASFRCVASGDASSRGRAEVRVVVRAYPAEEE